MSTKLTKRFLSKHSLNWTGSNTLEKIKADIKKLESLGVTHLEIDVETLYDEHFVKIVLFEEREETNEEYEARLDLQNYTKKKTEEYELKQLARLKTKYEGKHGI